MTETTPIVLNVEQRLQVKAIAWRPPMTGELALDILTRWNQGHSSRHIAGELGLSGPNVAGRAIATLRGRLPDLPIRQPDATKAHGVQQVEDESWWTLERTKMAKELFTATDLHVDLIAHRLGTTPPSVWAKIRSSHWVRPRMSPGRRSNPAGSNLMKAIEGRAKATNLREYEAVNGSAPVEFWKVEPGHCRFVLEDKPGNMSEALCCNAEIAADAPRNHPYCPVHPGGTKTGFEDPLAAGRRTASVKDLERLARNFR